MTCSQNIANSILWAAAIVAAAILDAPTTLTVLILPTLATTAWLVAIEKSRRRSSTIS